MNNNIRAANIFEMFLLWATVVGPENSDPSSALFGLKNATLLLYLNPEAVDNLSEREAHKSVQYCLMRTRSRPSTDRYGGKFGLITTVRRDDSTPTTNQGYRSMHQPGSNFGRSSGMSKVASGLTSLAAGVQLKLAWVV